MDARITALVLNYKGASDTIECLDSLKKSVGVNLSLLVIDNASPDDSIERIQKAHPDVELIKTESNLGYAGGNNFGAKHAIEKGCDYVFIVNNDTTLEPDCLQKLLACHLSNEKVGIVAPAIYFYDHPELPWFTGGVIDIVEGMVDHVKDDVRTQKVNGPIPSMWITGCAMLIPSEVMQISGGFDEKFFCYWEDTDLSFRVRRLGFECLVCPEAILYHKISATLGATSPYFEYYMLRNQLLFAAKHTAGKDRVRAFRSAVSGHVNRWLHTKRTFWRNKRERIYMLAMWDYVFKKFGQCTHAL